MRADRPRTLPMRVCLDGHREAQITRGSTLARARSSSPRACEIQVDDGALSSVHFRLRAVPGGWWLDDAQSKNGTLVDGQRVDSIALRDGAVIEAGQTFFVFRACEAPPAGDVVHARELAGRPRGLGTLHPGLEDRFLSLARVASSRLPVLIRGETGTGKDLVARAIHELSARPGPLVAVNCASIPPDLLHAELFGARRGAYSGAIADRQGLARAADRGTLFFDEIAELPAGSQVSLLRLLQEHEVMPLGATQAVPVDLRFIAATHADVNAIGFRPDLLARLAGAVFTLPPLRERREDLGMLVAEFLEDCEAPADLSFSLAAARQVMHGAWRLNIRQLRHGVSAAVLSGDRQIDGARLSLDGLSPLSASDGSLAPRAARRGAVTGELLAGLLRTHAGNVSAVARVLATSRTQITRLMHRFGLDPWGNSARS
ncbi:MAG TPA: sigma 54-interacting transcriptional regulator [Kofleriaceae bacterium]|nr:sigma 54-interacting transcriptional regulator [Kofleriaceae bacterium]